jgi:hypothetical protein
VSSESSLIKIVLKRISLTSNTFSYCIIQWLNQFYFIFVGSIRELIIDVFEEKKNEKNDSDENKDQVILFVRWRDIIFILKNFISYTYTHIQQQQKKKKPTIPWVVIFLRVKRIDLSSSHPCLDDEKKNIEPYFTIDNKYDEL